MKKLGYLRSELVGEARPFVMTSVMIGLVMQSHWQFVDFC